MPAVLSRWLLIVFATLLLMAAFAARAIDVIEFKDRAEEQRFQHLARQLRCLVCQNESLADSSADLAKDLRTEVFEQMRQGKTDDEIKHYLTARYSDFVLYNPPLRSGTLLLWFGPLAVLVAGAAIVAMIVRKRRIVPLDSQKNTSEDDW